MVLLGTRYNSVSTLCLVSSPQAYGTIVDDLAQRFIGLGLAPEEDTYRALMLAYGRRASFFTALFLFRAVFLSDWVPACVSLLAR